MDKFNKELSLFLEELEVLITLLGPPMVDLINNGSSNDLNNNLINSSNNNDPSLYGVSYNYGLNHKYSDKKPKTSPSVVTAVSFFRGTGSVAAMIPLTNRLRAILSTLYSSYSSATITSIPTSHLSYKVHNMYQIIIR
jgi:hypothetical protein